MFISQLSFKENNMASLSQLTLVYTFLQSFYCKFEYKTGQDFVDKRYHHRAIVLLN